MFSKMQLPLTKTFRVREVNGTREYTVVLVNGHADTANRRMIHASETRFRLADSSSELRRLDFDTFEIMRTGQVVRRIPETK
jgi:hypothetical protein